MNAKHFAGLRPLLGAAGIVTAMLVAPVAAQGPELAMLNGLRDGAWDIKIRGEETKSRICIHSGREFIQLRHRQLACERLVVDDGASLVTVHYSCPKAGFGQTTIRKETTTLVQINSQGVEGKQPFNFDAEARYAGSC
jgi:hypothetical protein